MLQDEEHAYIVQELCAGGDLKSLLDANGCVSEVEAATIMRGVLDMLVELHRCVFQAKGGHICSVCGLP
jgi:serine/threonine protein kinase